MSDALWARVAPVIPPAPSHAKGGRPRLPDREAFAAIVYVLRTGIQWNALPLHGSFPSRHSLAAI